MRYADDGEGVEIMGHNHPTLVHAFLPGGGKHRAVDGQMSAIAAAGAPYHYATVCWARVPADGLLKNITAADDDHSRGKHIEMVGGCLLNHPISELFFQLTVCIDRCCRSLLLL